MTEPGYCYLIAFDRPIGSERHKAQLYLGSTAMDPWERLKKHRTDIGSAAKILWHCETSGIGFQIILVWEFHSLSEAREFERKRKRTKKNSLLLSPKWQEKASYKNQEWLRTNRT